MVQLLERAAERAAGEGMQVRKDSTTKKAAACVGANSGGGSAPNLAVRVGRSMVDEQVLRSSGLGLAVV